MCPGSVTTMLAAPLAGLAVSSLALSITHQHLYATVQHPVPQVIAIDIHAGRALSLWAMGCAHSVFLLGGGGMGTSVPVSACLPV